MGITSDPLVGKELERRVGSLAEGWEIDAAGLSIERLFVFPSFRDAFAFMTAVADKAEEMDHHPEWTNVYNRVNVRLTTHSAGGVTDLDLDLARFIDEITGG